MNHIDVGNRGEEAAVRFLRQMGYTVVARKYRAKPGEIDIIAHHKGIIVFVEVKTRRNITFGFPAEAVTYSKRRKLIKTALCYLKQTKQEEAACRFDVLEVLAPQGKQIQVNHIVNAFENGE